MHTPTPWLIRDDKETLTGPDELPVAATSFPGRSTEECEGNAASIALAVSNHQALVEALKKAANALEAIAELTWDKRNPDATRNACDEASSLANTECEEARAALAAVEQA
jgi:hypothetical protein